MKPSRYNHFVPVDGKLYAFNCLTERFFPVPDGREETYRTLLDNPDINAEAFASFYKKMLATGFVVEDDTDEMTLVREKYDALCRHHEFSLMILPTYACNLRCWSCIQKHKNVNLAPDYYERIKRLLEKAVAREDIQAVQIWWFGGEPLLKYERILEINNFARTLCEQADKRFSSNITTNATLLTPERVDCLRESGVNHYQISIDGPKRIHDTVKVLQGRSAFDHALSIVDYIAKHTHVTLRFNYTHETLLPEDVIKDLSERLSTESRLRIRFMMIKVWQENRDKISPDLEKRLSDLASSYNLHPGKSTCGLCYTDYKNFFTVFPNGRIDKCDNLEIEKARGELTSEGDIVWPENLPDATTAIDLPDIECYNCNLLPICWGPCVGKRYKMLSCSKSIRCVYPSQKDRTRNCADIIHDSINLQCSHNTQQHEND